MRNINLYRLAKIQRQSTPLLRHARLGAFVLVPLLIAHASWLGWQLQQAKQRTEQLRVGAELIQQEREQLEENFRLPVLDEALPLELAKAEAVNRELERLDDYLRLLDSAAVGGYASVLQGLSERHQQGIWLTRIELNEGLALLRLRGNASSQAQVKPYLDSLGGHGAFTGRLFRQFELKRDEAGFQHFSLSSDLQEATP